MFNNYLNNYEYLNNFDYLNLCQKMIISDPLNLQYIENPSFIVIEEALKKKWIIT